MAKYTCVLVALLVLSLVLPGCSTDEDESATATATPPDGAAYTDVLPVEARALIDTDPELVVLDVSPLYDQGHVPGAINLPMFDGTLEEALPSLDEDAPYLVYCHSDSVSQAAAQLLVDAGFGEVYRLEGNFAAWVAAGYEVEPSDGPTPTPGAWSPDGVISPGEYDASRTYDAYEVHWTTDSQYLYAALQARTDGWVAIAIQPGQRMKNADMVYGYVDDGEATVVDMFSTGDFGPHPPDEQQGGTNDILEYGGAEAGGVTIIEFKRLLVTGDRYDQELAPGANKIIWAYGGSDSLTQRHSKRGYGELNL